MKKNVISIYAVFAVLIYIFSVLFFCTSLYKEYNKGKASSEEDFNIILSRLNREFEKNQSSQSAALVLRDFTQGSDKIAQITLENNGHYIFTYPDYAVSDSKYVKNFSYSFSNTQAFYNLNAKMYILRPSVIAKYGKSSFLIILAVTLLTLLLIVYYSYFDATNNTGTVKELEQKKTDDCNEPLTAEDENIRAKEEVHEEEALPEEAQEEEAQEEEENALKGENNADEGNVLENEAAADEGNVLENEAAAGKDDDSKDKNTTEDFAKLVEEELNNSISNEKEFAFFIMKVHGIAQTSEEYRKMIEILEDRMRAQGLIFEGKDNCIIILKHDTNLDENLTIAENTINELENTFEENKPIFYMGISNRNQRIVTPQRLMFEAEAALNHAEETEEKVIAFRANAEQYNNYINQQA